MEIIKKVNDDEIVITLKGRLDTTTSLELDKELDTIDNSKSIVYDFQDLEYISSAGLRSILTTKKKNNNTKVINCNSEVYDTFNMTGFTEIIDVSKATKSISIEGCEIINKGVNNTLYRLDNEKIVKVYNEGYSIDLVKKEIEYTRKAFVLGIPTIIPYELVKVGNLDGAVYELVDSKSLQQLLIEGESIEDIVKEMVELLKKVHSVEPEDDDFPSRKKKIIEMATKCRELLPKESGEKLMSLVYEIPMANTMIHGNYYINNIMKKNDELLLIDMDTVSTGHPILELGTIYVLYKGISCVDKKRIEEHMGITQEMSDKILELIFKDYFNDKTPEQISKIMDKASVIAYMELLWLRSSATDQDETTKKEIEFCIKYLVDKLTDIDSLIV